MAADLNPGEALAAVAGAVSISFAVGAGLWAFHAYRTGRMGRGWRWLRVETLGGVTTLERTLSDNCAICQYSLDAHEKVRQLSCGHVFHCRGTEKCEAIEKWLCERSMTCPFCRETPRTVWVWPWQARPPVSSAPAPATSSSASASQPLEQSAAGSSSAPPPVLEEEEEKPLLEP